MASNELDSFAKIRDSIKPKWLKRRTIEILEKDPNTSKRKIAQILGVSDGSLEKALKQKDGIGLNLEKIIGSFLGIDFLFAKGFDADRDSLVEIAFKYVTDKLKEFPQVATFLGGLWIILKRIGPIKINEFLLMLTPIAPLLVPFVLILGALIVIPFLFRKLESIFDTYLNLLAEKWGVAGEFIDDATDTALDFVIDPLGIQDDPDFEGWDCGGQSFKSKVDWLKGLSWRAKMALSTKPHKINGAYKIAAENWRDQNCTRIDVTLETIAAGQEEFRFGREGR